MKKYSNFFNNKNYLKYTHILFFTNTTKIANKLEEIPIVSKTITCSPNLNNSLNVFSFALSQVKNSNIQYDIYLTITTNKFEGMQFYYNKLDLIFNNLENIFYKPIHSQVFL